MTRPHPPERLPIFVRLSARVREGMSSDEARELFWREAAAEGLLDVRTQPPQEALHG